jgi:hypothetical protein
VTFARWQPAYAEHGVPLVPCEIVGARKKPLVKHPERFGRRGSAEIASNFPDAAAFGFYAGKRSRITILDVDTTDERVLRDALDRHGATPLIVRTASGKFHGYFRNGGETRSIRPWKAQGLPIDLLGGGLSIAPPSVAAHGNYQIVEGTLDDLDRLPTLRGLDPELYQRKPSPSVPTPSGAESWEQMRDGDGRNRRLFERLGRNAHHCDDFDALLDCALTFNQEFAEPMSDAEVATITRSIWKYTSEGRNRFGQHGSWLTLADVDALIAEPFTLALLNHLKAHNAPDSTFWVADGFANVLKWPLRKFKKARERLINTGWIICISKRSPGHPAWYRWRK